MALKDFLDEVHSRAGNHLQSSAEKDIHDFAHMVYNSIKQGTTRLWVKKSARMFVQSIAPTISPSELEKGAHVIEGIALTVLSELFEDGVLMKKEAYKDEAK